jgi:hypothetical protein
MTLRNEIGRLLQNADRFGTALFSRAPAAAAEKVVADLQQLGPAWTGRFSNSWQISSASRVVSGTGQEGKPQKISSPLLSGRELLGKPEVKYTISNFASGPQGPYALVAMDLQEGTFINPGTPPLKPFERGTRISGIRGKLNIGASGSNRRTAPLDWFSTYVNGGQIDNAVRVSFDQALRGIL